MNRIAASATSRFDGPALATTTALSLGICAAATLLEMHLPEHYYRIVQEDEALEWTTFWCFFTGGLVFLWVALIDLQGRADRSWLGSWFGAGLGLFCLFVAMEEISWGQRLLGYRAPTYFLEHNFQQELNIHNVLRDDLRQLGFLVITLGYGVALPLVDSIPRFAGWLLRVGVASPPSAVVPTFAIAGLVYAWYPWKFAGEWTELMLGCAFLCTALLQLWERGAGVAPGLAQRPAAGLALALAAVALAGVGTAEGAFALQRDQPHMREAARVELEALRKDLLSPRARTRCGLHKRVYSYVEKYRVGSMRKGAFAGLAAGGLPRERAEFFIDPWSSPYWVRHMCSADRTRRSVFVYSLGPNRKRDSSRWEIRADDVGVYVERDGESSSGIAAD